MKCMVCMGECQKRWKYKENWHKGVKEKGLRDEKMMVRIGKNEGKGRKK